MKEIPLTKGLTTLVDDEDYDFLSQWKWQVQPSRNTYYATRSETIVNGKRLQIRMHRVILGLKDFEIKADHIDRNGLNNQKNNLRVATVGQNNFNKSGHKSSRSKYKGVSWYRRNKKWGARIRIKGQAQIFLGIYKTEEEAARAYDAAAKIHHGEFAYLNFID